MSSSTCRRKGLAKDTDLEIIGVGVEVQPWAEVSKLTSHRIWGPGKILGCFKQVYMSIGTGSSDQAELAEVYRPQGRSHPRVTEERWVGIAAIPPVPPVYPFSLLHFQDSSV